jgi:hypothetical protein
MNGKWDAGKWDAVCTCDGVEGHVASHLRDRRAVQTQEHELDGIVGAKCRPVSIGVGSYELLFEGFCLMDRRGKVLWFRGIEHRLVEDGNATMLPEGVKFSLIKELICKAVPVFRYL